MRVTIVAPIEELLEIQARREPVRSSSGDLLTMVSLRALDDGAGEAVFATIEPTEPTS